MTNNEATKYADKYLNEITEPINKSVKFNYDAYWKVLTKRIPYESPDFYAVEGDTIYIFEHFSFDASKRTKKGSKRKAELGWIKSEFNKESIGKIELHKSGQLETDVSLNDYLKNLYESFDDHYQKIELYKKNICNTLGCDLTRYKFKVTFMIEDSGVFGTTIDTGSIELVKPVFTKEFLQFLKKKEQVDYVISSVSLGERRIESWFYTRESHDFFEERAIDLLSQKINDSKPDYIQFSLFVPRK